MITLYWAPRSRAARMFWLMEEIGQPYDLAHVDITDASVPRPAGFAEASPLGKVPALADGDLKMADSGAIALYLADRYAAGELAPPLDHPSRGAFLYWVFYTHSAMEPAMTEKWVDMPSNPGSYGWGSYERAYGAVESHLDTHEWFAWDRFTVADFMMAGTLEAMQMFNIQELSPRLKDYVETCRARPAYARGDARRQEAEAALAAS
ncbi:glutathione S-transferase [Rhodobacterales bacterium HKCCE2091]|nr:glutathione S-transferase [Rhodobacterales bacterium HKCCE2091]